MSHDKPVCTFLPTRFGNYELLQRLAVGGMAEIFLARTGVVGGVQRYCVIKRILPSYSCDRRFVSMFIDEARITIRLEHPHIVQLFDFGAVDGTYFMAIDYIDGIDLVEVLRHLRRASHRIEVTAAAYVVACVARGLHHAHTLCDANGESLEIVHRDVSPHNVFLSWQGKVKLGDFGIAKAKSRISKTSFGELKGKFAFMAPEQVRGAHVDAKTDVWACGVMLHEMLVGSRLFAAENPAATLARVCEQRILPPSTLNPDVPEALDQLVLRALERDPDRRLSSAAALADGLMALCADRAFDEVALGEYLRSVDWAIDKVQIPKTADTSSDAETAVLQRAEPEKPLVADPVVERLVASLSRQPNLWTLVEIGERYVELGETSLACGAFRVAALRFATNGWPIQALCAYHGAQAFLPEDEVLADLEFFSTRLEASPAAPADWLRSRDPEDWWTLITRVEPPELAASARAMEPSKHAMLFGRLSPTNFARLAVACRVNRVELGQRLIIQGEEGTALFALGRGKAVVYCKRQMQDDAETVGAWEDTPHESSVALSSSDEDAASERRHKAYVSALTEGDFFGEFSFLTRRPRSATVEAIAPGLVLEIPRATAESVLQRDPAFRRPLLEFYTERVGELLLAKNPVFGLVTPAERRQLLGTSTLCIFGPGELIFREGDRCDHMYFIKRGEVEVCRDDAGIPVFISKLREGCFFGEIAALRGQPRSATVRAMGEVELLRIPRDALLELVNRQARMRALLESAAEWRSADAAARFEEARRIFWST